MALKSGLEAKRNGSDFGLWSSGPGLRLCLGFGV